MHNLHVLGIQHSERHENTGQAFETLRADNPPCRRPPKAYSSECSFSRWFWGAPTFSLGNFWGDSLEIQPSVQEKTSPETNCKGFGRFSTMLGSPRLCQAYSHNFPHFPSSLAGKESFFWLKHTFVKISKIID